MEATAAQRSGPHFLDLLTRRHFCRHATNLNSVRSPRSPLLLGHRIHDDIDTEAVHKTRVSVGIWSASLLGRSLRKIPSSPAYRWWGVKCWKWSLGLGDEWFLGCPDVPCEMWDQIPSQLWKHPTAGKLSIPAHSNGYSESAGMSAFE